MTTPGSLKTWCQSAVLALAFILAQTGFAANPQEVLLQDFESGDTAGAAAVEPGNSPAGVPSNSTVMNVTDEASRRLRISDADGGVNGAVITIPAAIPAAGYYLITCDVKVHSIAAVASFGMGAVIGAPTPTRVPDENAGYVMNLSGSGDAALGYQTIGAAVRAPEGATYPQDLTLYFSSDVSGNSYNAPASDGDFANSHRGNAGAFTSPDDAVFVDNIKRYGPGNFGEERHLWISVGDVYTNRAALEDCLVKAKANNFNCVDILARYRADAYYVPNRTDASYPNPEPFGSRVGTTPASPENDPLQYAIDRGHELGLKVYISFSCFLVSPNASYPATLPVDSVMYAYNAGAPRPMLSSEGEGLWADPGRADVREYTKNVLMDIVSNYDIDGVVFDRIRYPGRAFSYNPVSLAEMGLGGTIPAQNNAAFLDARRKAITQFAGECYEAVTTKKPWVVVGSTPIAFGDRLTDTYNYVFQHWPMWMARKTANRVVNFGCMDLMQPQFYRKAEAAPPYDAPAANTRLMNLAQYGDRGVYSLDFGLMPGALTAVAPLFYHPTTGDLLQSRANAQNIADARDLAMNGFGFFPATRTLADIAMLRDPAASSSGVDVLASPVERTDYLFKAGYETVPPEPVTNFAAAPQPRGSVILSWTASATASDGDPAENYLIYRSASTPVKEYWANLVTKAKVPGSTTWLHLPVGEEGNYYYKIVPVDDYNNHGTAVEIGPIAVAGSPSIPADVIVDNPNATFVGSWLSGSSSGDKYGTNYHYRTSGTGANTATFTADLEKGGQYEVFEWHPRGSARCTAVQHVVAHTGGQTIVPVNQRYNGGKWNSLGKFVLNAGSNVVTITDKTADGTVMVDAIMWRFSPDPIPVPETPSGLTATPVDSATVNLAWTDNSSVETGYEVERTLRGGATVIVATLPANTTAYADAGLAADSEYIYVVRAYNTGAQSQDSNVAVARTLPEAPPDIIIDNPQASFIGSWQTGTYAGKYGADYRSCYKGTGLRTATFQFNVERTAVYDVYEWHVAGGNRATDAPHFVTHRDGTARVNVNQTLNHARWNKIGTYQFTAGQPGKVVITDGYTVGSVVMADAIKVVYVSEPPSTPLAPSGLVATVISDTEIGLAWNDNSANENSFELERTKTGGAPEVVAVTGANVISFADTGLVANTEYTYVVRAINGAGKSSPSNAVTVSTLSNLPPDVIVDNVDAQLVGEWTITSYSSDRYGVNYAFRSKNGGGKAIFSLPVKEDGVYSVYEWHSAGSNRTQDAGHTVSSLEGESRVVMNQMIDGGKWNKIGTFQFAGGSMCVVTIDDVFQTNTVVIADAIKLVYEGELPPAPAAPEALSATTKSQTEIELAWQDKSDDETAFEIVRSAAGAAPVIIRTAANATSYTDSGLSANTEYSYVVRAANKGVKSADSNAASATTLPNPPAAPEGLQVVAVSGTEAALTWADRSDNETGFEVALNGETIATLPAGATAYAAAGLAECTQYVFAVRAFNSGGDSADATAEALVIDVTVPTITAPTDVTANADSGSCSAGNVALGAPIATDNCGEVSVANDGPAAFPVGDTIVTWTATDALGNKATATQKVTVKDAEVPTITAPADVTVAADPGKCSASGVLPGEAVTADNCGVASVSSDAPATYAKGETVVTWTVADIHGNVATASQKVIVEDREAPVIAAPPDVTIGANLAASIPVTWELPVATDNCGEATVECEPASGSSFPVGTRTVTCTATDSAGNSSQVTFKVVREALGFSGFAEPIGGCVESGDGGSFDSPVRAFKLGSTVPVKMQVLIDGVAQTAGVHTLSVQKYDGATMGGAAIDATPTDAATTGNEFRLAGAEWHFNWKTKGLSAGTWLITATLSDGSTKSVWIDLK